MTTIAQYRMRNTAYVFTLTHESPFFRGIVSTLVTGQFDRPVDSADFETEDQARDWLNAEWTRRSAARTVEIVADAVYIIGFGENATIYRTQWNMDGTRVYAKRLDLDPETGKGRFVFARGAMRDITEHGRRISLEEAREYGHAFGVCCKCGALLTNPESVAAGIGPVCAGRL